jgi:hypothetical protein
MTTRALLIEPLAAFQCARCRSRLFLFENGKLECAACGSYLEEAGNVAGEDDCALLLVGGPRRVGWQDEEMPWRRWTVGGWCWRIVVAVGVSVVAAWLMPLLTGWVEGKGWL